MIIHEEVGKEIYAVTVTETGIKHAVAEESNQDSNAFLLNGADMMMAVADGVGSCKMADVASEKACSICKEVFDILVSGSGMETCAEIVAMIVEKWYEFLTGKDGKEYCTTLKAVFIVRGILSAVSVGDGLLMMETDGEVIVSPEDEHDFLNQTNCLSPGFDESSVWAFQRDLSGKSFTVFMSTDGVSNSIVEDQETELLREISGIVENEILKEELTSFFSEIRLVSADDMTLGVIRYGH